MKIYTNPEHKGSNVDTRVFTHFEVDRVIMDAKGCCYRTGDDPGPGDTVLWGIYGRYDPELNDGFGGMEWLWDEATEDAARAKLARVLGITVDELEKLA